MPVKEPCVCAAPQKKCAQKLLTPLNSSVHPLLPFLGCHLALICSPHAHTLLTVRPTAVNTSNDLAAFDVLNFLEIQTALLPPYAYREAKIAQAFWVTISIVASDR